MNVRLLLAGLLFLGAQEAESPDAETAKAVRAALDAGKDAATARVREAKDAVAAESREEEARDGRIERALKEITAKTPLRVALSENVILNGVRVTAYFGGRVTLTWPQGEVEYPLEMLPDETRGALVGIALSRASPRDHFEMGKLLVRGKDFDRGARCFATAAKLDPALAPFVPDLERVKKAARLFEGSFKAVGSTLSLRWEFSGANQAADFQALQGSLAVRPGQGLEIDGAKVALAAVREIPFRDRIRASALARETDVSAHLMGIRFVKPDGGEVLIYGGLATSIKSFLVIRVEDGKSQELLAPTGGAAGNRMTMDFDRGRFAFKVGERTVWSGNEGGFTDVTVLVGALALSKPGSRARAQYKDVTLAGGVNPQWMAKKTAGLRDALGSELSKEHRARRGDAAGSLALSIDAAITRAPAMIQDGYKVALTKVATMRKSQLQEDLVAAQAAMDQVAAAQATFAPAWYWRGALAETAGDRRTASDHYDRALALLPEFPEALCGRARLGALSGKWDQVRESVDRALALKPDLGEAHLLRARLMWEARESLAVIETTQVARRLAPGDPEIQSNAQMLANVARGPRWSKPNAHATAHYAVRSDLPAAKCRLYAEHLETLRPHYEEVLGRPLPAGKPAEVLIFESEEGYFIYNDFTVGSRQEHSLGAFSPWHGQMALFEGVESEETLKVLAHEGFHQSLHALAPDVPIWFNEGMAEYVGAARVEKGKVVERGGIQSGRLDNLKLAVKYGWQPLSFDKIMLESQAEFYGPQAPFKYAQAWSMIRYFMNGEGGRWKPLLRDYTERLLQSEPAKSAFDSTFAKQDLKALEAGWLKHYGLVITARRAPAAAPASEPGPAVDLMAALAGKKFPMGGWFLVNNGLESRGRLPGGLVLDYEPPEEYEWLLTVQRFWGTGFLALGLQGGGSTFLLKVDDQGSTGIEALDGARRNETFVRHVRLPSPMTVTLVCRVNKAGVSLKAGSNLVLDWKGEFQRLSYLGGGGLPAPTRSLFLAVGGDDHFRITDMAVRPLATEPVSSAAKIPLPKIAVDPARSIPVGCDITRWIVDEDHRHILALDPSGHFLQISMTEKRVVRRISVGAEPSAICLVPGSSRTVWVAGDAGKNLVKLDLEKGEAVDSIPAQFPAGAIAAVRKYIFYSAIEGAAAAGVDTSDRKDLGRLSAGSGFVSGFTHIVYESRKDRLWGAAPGILIEFEASKLGATMRELQRTNLGGWERGELTRGLAALPKSHPVKPAGIAASRPRMLLDEKNGRMYVGISSMKLDKPETLLGVFRAAAHALDGDPAVVEYYNRTRSADQMLAASPDGKWVASGKHLFSASSFEAVKEIPLPTSLVAFSKDSKELCYFDWVNQVVAVMNVEGK